MHLVYRLLLVSVVMVSGWNGTDLEHHIDSLAKSSSCICFDSQQPEFNKECRCFGDLFTQVPLNLTSDMERLTITNAGIESLSSQSLQPYRQLREFTVMQVNKLRTLEQGLFNNLTHLRTIYIYSAPSLVELLPGLFDVSLPRLKILRIMNTGLTRVPDLHRLSTAAALVMVDLENNQINQLNSNSVKMKAESLVLNYNKIQRIDSWTFNQSQIAKVSLKGNSELTQLTENSFSGLQSLRYLDLSETSISVLPTDGLQELDVLKIENTKTLKVFPSVYKFKFIREVFLTHACHCCAFKFPQKHNSDEHFKHQEQLRQCDEQQIVAGEERSRRKRSWENEMWPVDNSTVIQHVWGDFQSVAPLAVQTTPPALDPVGVFHPAGVTLSPGRIHALCGNLSKDYQEVLCLPAPDAFNPCEDLMGHWGLRVAVWVVAVLALVGNIAVVLVLLSSRFRFTVPKFLICNLAVADFCMGLYLLLLAVMDARSIGDYFNYAIDWQYGNGCSIAGFLTVLSSELSIFTLAVITVERWYTITYAIHLNRRLRLSTAVRIMALGWIYSITMALFPLMGVSSYSKTSICLPLENVSTVDYSYLATLLMFNGLAFVVICACYGRMYCSIRGGQDAAATLTRADLTVAKRMALLVFTDFACWAPIAFFGITALAGYPLIDVSKTKILLVFFYPLNSCANPYLYALLTQQYRRDLFVLLSRHGLCAHTAARYKGTGVIQRGGTSHTAQRRVDLLPESINHRGSLLTTVTSFDCATRPGSLDMVPECPLSILSRDQSEHTLVLNKNSSYL